MKTNQLIIGAILSLLSLSQINAQEQEATTKSNIQNYTPSKLLGKGKWDLKFFNGLFTMTQQTDAESEAQEIPRQNFFTTTTEVYTGISNSARVNIGLISQVRSNTINDQGVFSVFNFEDNNTDARSGFTTLAPSIRFQPFANIANFSITSNFYFPIFKSVPNAPYLDQKSFAWENRFFYDTTFGDDKWQVFSGLDLKFNFGKQFTDADEDDNQGELFANESIFTNASVFLSYFPSSKSTVYVNAGQTFLFGINNRFVEDGDPFSQNGTNVGFGFKYQLTDALNIESGYSKIVRGYNFQGLGSTFSLGLRAIL